MLLGYNTNGLADHDLSTAIELVAELGYQAIAITLDHAALHPFGPQLPQEIAHIRDLLERYRLAVVIETGARYLLDPRRKHQPTLVSATAADRHRRIDFLCRAIDIARQLDAICVSFWSGTPLEDANTLTCLSRLAESLPPVLRHAQEQGVAVGFEPEPGMAIDTLAAYEQLLTALPTEWADRLQLTIDIGHLHCQQEVPIVTYLEKYASRIVNLHIEDMRHGVHEHLRLGEGEIEFPPILAMLEKIHYTGPLVVELSRHSHLGYETAQQSSTFLRRLMEK